MASRSSDRTIETTGVVSTPRPVSSLASAETMPASDGHRVLEEQRIARYTVKHVLGRGGMGEVWAAYDPELDRMVAIKLLRPELSTTRADARLRREARSMAKLSHRNLVTVHDVGVHDGQLFVAMELIDGDTLRGWQRGRRWREIVGAYVAAGRGLAAAHAAEIVHRDFKPDNVLVGRDGRVAVGDFGLAMSSDEDTPLPAKDVALTQAGALVGTVRYMAPEQLARHTADARSDQFSFCLALWEALDKDPFGDLVAVDDIAAVAEVRRAVIKSASPRKIPGLPARITRALARGLSFAAEDRWPSMDELLHAIDPNRRRNRIAVASFALGTIAIAVGATWWARSPAVDRCSDAASPMADVWIPGSVKRLQTAFAATKRANADEVAQRTAAILDRRATAWTVMRVDSCEATSAGRQSSVLDAQRTLCLDSRRAELEALVTALTHSPTTDMIDSAVRTANALPSVEQCSNLSALQEREPVKATVRAQIAQLEVDVARADTLETLGDPNVEAQLPALLERATALDWSPSIARVSMAIGHAAWRRDENPAAIEPLRQAAIAAARAKDDDLAARALALEAEVLVDSDRASDAVEVAHAAEVAAARAGDPPALRSQATESLAVAYAGESKFDEADKAYAQTVALLDTPGTDQARLGGVLVSWANMLREQSEVGRALPLCERGVELARVALGDHDPDYARGLQSLGNIYVDVHRYPEAKQKLEASLAIKEALYGPDAPTVAMNLHSLGNIAELSGDLDGAAALYQRAYDSWSKSLGPDHSLAVMARYSLGVNLHERHKIPEAIKVLDDVLAKRTAVKNPQPEKIANVLVTLARCYLELGDKGKALDHATRALAMREKALGPTAADVGESLSVLADVQHAMGDCAKAKASAERAIAIYKGLPGGDEDAKDAVKIVQQCSR